tara:strand:+ start:1356 stop:2252 length:897 start_codon:yes stop_codon:yes gene_type:complete
MEIPTELPSNDETDIIIRTSKMDETNETVQSEATISPSINKRSFPKFSLDSYLTEKGTEFLEDLKNGNVDPGPFGPVIGTETPFGSPNKEYIPTPLEEALAPPLPEIVPGPLKFDEEPESPKKKTRVGGLKKTGGSKKSKTKKRLKLKGLKKKSLQKKGTKKGSKKGAGNNVSSILQKSSEPSMIELSETDYKSKQEMLDIVVGVLDNIDYEQADARIKLRDQEINLNEIDEWLRNFVEAAAKVNKIKMLEEEIEATKNDPHSDIYKIQYLEKLHSLTEELEKLGSFEDAKEELAKIN